MTNGTTNKPKGKMRHCFYCGEELGISTWSEPYDHCGKSECAREADYAMQSERAEAHERLDEQNGW